MAGTPTQYYGFPTYADSDAVDLTAQYNTAMTNIDSELHQLDASYKNIHSEKRHVLIFGDSWTDPSSQFACKNWVSMVDDAGFITHNYANYGKRITDNLNAQINEAIADVPNYYNVTDAILLMGVNDLSTGVKPATIVDALNSCANTLVNAYPNIRLTWFLNGRGTRAATDEYASELATGFREIKYLTSRWDKSLSVLEALVLTGQFPYSADVMGSANHPTGATAANVIASIVINRLYNGSLAYARIMNDAASGKSFVTVDGMDVHINLFSSLNLSSIAIRDNDAFSHLLRYFCVYDNGAAGMSLGRILGASGFQTPSTGYERIGYCDLTGAVFDDSDWTYANFPSNYGMNW